MRSALEMHEFGVQLYRQRMRREHPEASRDEIDSMVRDWLTAPSSGGRRRLPSRGPGHGYARCVNSFRNADSTESKTS